MNPINLLELKRMERRQLAPVVILLVLAFVLAATATWHQEARQASTVHPAPAQAVVTTRATPTQNQVPAITASPSLPVSSATATRDAWETYVVQTWKWAYQIQIPKGWYAIDYTNENAADSGMDSGEPRLGFASFSSASASGQFPEITVVVAVDDGGKQYKDEAGTVMRVGGSPAKMSTSRDGYVYVLHGNQTYEFALQRPRSKNLRPCAKNSRIPSACTFIRL